MSVNKKVLITGGAGFIGSHLAEFCLQQGCNVTVVDNYATGRFENIKHLTQSANFVIEELDIADSIDALIPVFKDKEWVFHCAALADIVPSITKPQEYHRANVQGTFCVLEAARRSGVKRFIYAASSSCYGIPDTFPTHEGVRVDPRYPYALTKYIGEQYALHWASVYKLPVVSLRLFNVYGPRSRTSGTYGAVFGVFLAQKLAGKPFTVVGDGTQTRDFVFVKDVVSAFYKAAQSDLSGKIFNLGSGQTYSINLLCDLLGGRKEYIPKRPGEPDCTHADISEITKFLGWKPEVDFTQGVAIMLENIDYWKNAPLWDPASIQEATSEWFQYLGEP